MTIYTGALVRDRNGQLIRRPNISSWISYNSEALYRIAPYRWPQVKSITWSGDIVFPLFYDSEDRQLLYEQVFNHNPLSGEVIWYLHLRLAAGTYRVTIFVSGGHSSDSAYSVFGVTCPRAQYVSDAHYWSGTTFELPFSMIVGSSGQVYVNGVDCGIWPLG